MGPGPHTPGVVTLTLCALRRQCPVALPRYARALAAVCTEAPPPFGLAWYGTVFRRRATDAKWLAAGLAVNAAAEGAGARKLWRLAGRTPDVDVADRIRVHAIDEGRHALVYLAMLHAVFPTAVPVTDRGALRALSPRYGPDDRPPPGPPVSPRRLLDELVQMNIGEIRTRTNQLLLAPVIMTVCPRPERGRVRQMLAVLLDDETRHIGYTAALLEEALSGPQETFVIRTLRLRLTQFNRRTVDELEGGRRHRSTGAGVHQWRDARRRSLRSAVI